MTLRMQRHSLGAAHATLCYSELVRLYNNDPFTEIRSNMLESEVNADNSIYSTVNATACANDLDFAIYIRSEVLESAVLTAVKIGQKHFRPPRSTMMAVLCSLFTNRIRSQSCCLLGKVPEGIHSEISKKPSYAVNPLNAR